jgi:hypothetical protein
LRGRRGHGWMTAVTDAIAPGCADAGRTAFEASDSVRPANHSADPRCSRATRRLGPEVDVSQPSQHVVHGINRCSPRRPQSDPILGLCIELRTGYLAAPARNRCSGNQRSSPEHLFDSRAPSLLVLAIEFCNGNVNRYRREFLGQPGSNVEVGACLHANREHDTRGLAVDLSGIEQDRRVVAFGNSLWDRERINDHVLAACKHGQGLLVLEDVQQDKAGRLGIVCCSSLAELPRRPLHCARDGRLDTRDPGFIEQSAIGQPETAGDGSSVKGRDTGLLLWAPLAMALLSDSQRVRTRVDSHRAARRRRNGGIWARGLHWQFCTPPPRS